MLTELSNSASRIAKQVLTVSRKYEIGARFYLNVSRYIDSEVQHVLRLVTTLQPHLNHIGSPQEGELSLKSCSKNGARGKVSLNGN